MGLYHLKTPSSGHHAANKTYADGKIAKSGDSIIESGWRLRTNPDMTLMKVENGKMYIYHLATPTSNEHAATKKYVDDQVAAGGGGSSFSPGDEVVKLASGGSHSIKGSFYETSGNLYYVQH